MISDSFNTRAANTRAALLGALVAMTAVVCSPVLAQNTPGTHQDNSGMNGSLSHEDLEKLGGDHQQNGPDASRDSAASRAKAAAQSGALLKSLQIACEISDAQLVVTGTRRPAAGGREVETRVYEVACKGGLGYLLETQGADMPVGISCVTAEEARAADVSKGKQPGFFCKLPANKDVYATVTSLIRAGAGASCAVRNLQSFGRSEATQSDYSEVVCDDGSGFLLRLPRPGSQALALAMSCADAAKQGIKCRLTQSGPIDAPVTLDTFKTALAQNGVSCKIDQTRLIGQEDHLKRYVVEYLCADKAIGTVAYIPLAGNTNPYESLECSAAISRNIVCTLIALK